MIAKFHVLIMLPSMKPFFERFFKKKKDRNPFWGSFKNISQSYVIAKFPTLGYLALHCNNFLVEVHVSQFIFLNLSLINFNLLNCNYELFNELQLWLESSFWRNQFALLLTQTFWFFFIIILKNSNSKTLHNVSGGIYL